MMTTLVVMAAVAMSHQSAATLTENEKKATIDALFVSLNENYVFPDLAKKAEEAVRKALAEGAYKELKDGAGFAAQLAKDVNAVLHDAHFRMRYSATPLPERKDAAEPSQTEIDAMNLMIKRHNGGVAAADVLMGNIGYLEVESFLGGKDIARPAAAAFEMLKDTDALILDLRRNGGGDPEAVRILCSYFFGENPVHLNDIYWRPTGETNEFWTLKDLPGPRYVGKPVFVVTSKRTGSGAEECAYNLQTQKRAVVVGETTWGGANPGGNVRLTDHFAAFVPMGRAINPITKTNWEGTGVKPDVECPGSDALTRAQILALEELMKTADPDWKEELSRRVEDLKGTKEGVLFLLKGVSDM